MRVRDDGTHARLDSIIVLLQSVIDILAGISLSLGQIQEELKQPQVLGTTYSNTKET